MIYLNNSFIYKLFEYMFKYLYHFITYNIYNVRQLFQQV